jgi:hypothetical protein
MSIVLDTAGFWSAWDISLNAWTERLGGEMQVVPRVFVLLAVVIASYLLPFLLLRTPEWWRRAMLWVSFVIVAIAWWPVLALANWKIEPCLPTAALLWSGLCAMIYAQRHRLPCEEVRASEKRAAVVVIEETFSTPPCEP